MPEDYGSARATRSCQRSTVASGGSPAAASRSRRSTAAATCSGGSRWIVERCRARSCSAARSRGDRAGLLERSAQPHVAEARRRQLAASAPRPTGSARDRSRADRADTARRWWPVKCSGANVQMKSAPAPARARGAPRRARAARRSPSVWTTRRIVTASNQPLRNGQVVGLGELERGSPHAALARLGEHLLRGVHAPAAHAEALDRSRHAALPCRSRRRADASPRRGPARS